LRKRAEEFRRLAMKYKRNFGKEEREQRNLLLKEVKSIRAEIKKTQAYAEEKWMAEADVVAGTPIGLYDSGVDEKHFHTLVIDEAGQCLEPLAWCVIPLADKVVLAGDHFQLPPVVLSAEAARMGFNRSILEVALENVSEVHLLNVQYRMKPSIAGFSSAYFYDKLLTHAAHLSDSGQHFQYIDTAGSGYQEEHGPDGVSLQNEGELQLVRKLIDNEIMDLHSTAFISPYAGQVARAREVLPAGLRISTIDSFQGQEMKTIIVSLVRSNDDGEIGFLKDHRRMNVAITRAQENLYVIGDSATLAQDPFYQALMEYVESEGGYRTVWEFGVDI
jgi:superfamily I DNA and/or RNA helicase